MMSLQKSAVKTKTLRGFELSTVIGKGSYGEVWLARHIKDRKQYVLKKINLKSASDKERRAAEQEALLLSKLRHPNIVTYKDSFQSGERHLYIAMQYCEGGDLYTWLKERKGKVLEERQVVEWFIQIAMALQYLHERDILHRDLKTQNIFLTKNKIIKVGDLGIARVLENSSDMATTLIGTPYYMSPELFSSQPYNQKSDVWALGCCVYEMTTLRHAFNARDMNSLAFKILSGKLPPMPKLYTNELVSLIQSMLHQDPSKRPSVNKLLRLPYVKRNIALFLEETRQNRRLLPPSPGKALKSVPTSSSSSPSSVPSSSSNNRERRKKKLTSGDDQLDSGSVKACLDNESPNEDNIKSPSDDGLVHPEEEPKSPQPIAAFPSSVPSEEIFESPRSSASSSSTESSLNESSSTLANSENQTQDTVIANTIVQQPKLEDKQVKVPKKEPVKSRSLSFGNSEALSEHISVIKPKNSIERSRPLPPPPKIDNSSGEPQHGSSIMPWSSSSSSSSKECSANLGEGEAPKSLPNVLARQKRRAKKQSASFSLERPDSARVELKRPTVILAPAIVNHEKPVSAEEVADPRRHVVLRHRQPSMSIEDDDDNTSPEESSKEAQDKEDKEMKTLAKFLNTTLQNNASKGYDDKSDDESRVLPDFDSLQQQHDPAIAPLPQLHERATKPTPKAEESNIYTFPSPETLVQTKRLSDRISILEKNCEAGIGKEVLKQAIEILDKFQEEEVEPHLQKLLGEEKFAQYAGKIWQLKFCKQMSH